MSSSPILTICIVSYNTAELTLDAVRSACQDIERSSLTKVVEIILVDNDSSDNSVEMISAFAKSTPVVISLLKNKNNVGFSRANNQAIRMSQSKYLLLLNSDTYIQPHSLERLIEAMEDTPEHSTAQLGGYGSHIDRLGILSATLINPDGTIQHQGGSAPTLFTLANHMLMFDDLPWIGKLLPSTQHTGLRGTNWQMDEELISQDWVGGAAMLVRREMLDEIGLLDENIFMYAEDTELCVRARNRHWDVAIHPRAYVTHHQRASSTNQNAIIGEYKGYLYIWSKHRPLSEQQPAKMILKTGALLRKWIFGTIRRSEKAMTYQKVLESI